MEKIQLACRGRLNLLTTTTTSSPPPATRIRPPPGDRRSQPQTSDPTAMSVPAISFYASPTAGFSASPASHAAPSPYPDLDFAPRVPTTASSRRPAPGGLSCLFSSPPLPADEPEDLGCSHPYSYASPLRLNHSPVSVFHGPVSQGRASSGRRAAAQAFPRELARGGRDRMLGGFVRNALGCDVPREAPGRDAPDLPFEIELDEDREPYAAEMLSRLRARHRIFADDVVVEAFYEAEKAHRGQVRASGDPYLQHCAETAALLADIGANATIVAAGLLHDSMDDSSLNYDCIFRSFGAGVATLVVGVSRLSHLSKLARENDTACKSVEADRLRTMFLAMGDARAVLIKLADRLHNMMTLDALPPSKRERFAKETLEIFVPMANRLGVFNWKEQLENLCFKYLYTEQHKEISTKLAKSFDETMVANAEGKLEAALVAGGISYHALYGRHKSLYSIHCKMLKKNVTMNEIHDIHGLRLIVESEDDCYKALDIIHRLWTKVPERQKDYIAHPKFNGYQSLHTVVQNEDMQSIEIQIRTKEMHRHAEYGFAAHWRYKEGFRRHASYVVQIAEWARWVLTWQCETMHKDCHLSFNDIDSNRPLCSFPLHSEDCPYNNKPECNQDDPIYVILLENEMMSVQEFPPNSTMLELLERVSPGTAHWTTHGFPLNEELRPRLNSRPVIDLDQKLKMGDVIELTPAIPDESLPVYRKEIQRIFERGMAVRGVDYF